MSEINYIVNSYYRHTYKDELNYLKVPGLETYYVPGGLKLNSKYFENLFSKNEYLRNFSQYSISINENSKNKNLTDNQKSGLQSFKKILQRGDGTFISPEIETMLLKKYKIEFLNSPLPGDLKPTTIVFANSILKTYQVRNEKVELKIPKDTWGKPKCIFDSKEEEMFFNYCRNNFQNSSRWLHPQPKREFFNKIPGSADGREGVDFLFSPPWRKPIIIEILGKQHFLSGENPEDPLSSKSFRSDIEDLREDIVEVIGIPAFEVRNMQGKHWQKIMEIFEHPKIDKEIDEYDSKSVEMQSLLALELWSIGAFQNLFFELLQDKNLYCKKTWKLKLVNNNYPLTGMEVFLNFVYSIMNIWNCTELMPTKIQFINNLNENFKTYIFNKDKKEYVNEKPTENKVSTQNLIYLDSDKSYLENYELRDSSSNFFVRRVALPFKIKDDRSFKNLSQYIEPNRNLETELTNVMKFVFGKVGFRELQYESVLRTLEGNNTLVLLPTGSGKSLIYQLASLILPGPVLVISPTVALINNQHKNLNYIGIDKVASITSEVGREERQIVLDSISDGSSFLILCAPERLLTPAFEDHLRASLNNQHLSVGVIDEAHCISEWGQDFRTSYLGLGDRLNRISNKEKSKFKLPILALTGTASITVRDDILNETNLNLYDELRASNFNRNELSFDVYKNIEGKDKFEILKEFLMNELPVLTNDVNLKSFFNNKRYEHENNLVIIFVTTKGKKMIELYKKLREFFETQEINSDLIGLMWGVGDYGKYWEPSLGDSEIYKESIPEDFKHGRKKIIIATKAFGMGIDFPNVRCVVHYGISNSIESWYQEAGRAGRDENKSYCWTIFSEKNKLLSEELLRTDTHSEAKKVYDEKNNEIEKADDINSHMYFYHQQWKGLYIEIMYFLNFLSKNKENFQNFANEKQVIYRFNSGNDAVFGDDKDDKVIYRLKVLGFLKEWQKDYSQRKYNLFLNNMENFLKFKNLTLWLDRRMPTSTKGFTDKLKILGKNIEEKSSFHVIDTFLIQLNNFFPIDDRKDELDELTVTLKTISENAKSESPKLISTLIQVTSDIKEMIKELNLPAADKNTIIQILNNEKCNFGFIKFLKEQIKWYKKQHLENDDYRNQEISEKQRKNLLPFIEKRLQEIINVDELNSLDKYDTNTKYGLWIYTIVAEWEIHCVLEEKEDFNDIELDAYQFIENHATGIDGILIAAYAYLLNATYKSVAFERRVKHLQIYELARNFTNNQQLQKDFTNYFADADTEFSAILRQLTTNSTSLKEDWVNATKKVKSIENAKYDLNKFRIRAKEFKGWFHAYLYVIAYSNFENIENEIIDHLNFFKESVDQGFDKFISEIKNLVIPNYEDNLAVISTTLYWLIDKFSFQEINSNLEFQELLNKFIKNFPNQMFESNKGVYISNFLLLEKLKKLNKNLIEF